MHVVISLQDAICHVCHVIKKENFSCPVVIPYLKKSSYNDCMVLHHHDH